MSETEIISDITKRMESSIGALERNFSGLRTGRASPSLLDSVVVEVYGSKMPLSQVATVNVPDSRMLSVQVWDQNNAASVEKAIINADLGLNPSSDGALIRVPIPDLSEERRKELCKVASKYAEDSKVAIRNIRRDAMDKSKKLEKDGEISKDQQHDLADKIQKVTDEVVGRIDALLSTKENDIMSV